jgi:hypothetical protein
VGQPLLRAQHLVPALVYVIVVGVVQVAAEVPGEPAFVAKRGGEPADRTTSFENQDFLFAQFPEPDGRAESGGTSAND